MITDEEIVRVTKKSAKFRPALRAVRYEPETDRVEFVTPSCTLLVPRREIDEFKDVSSDDMKDIRATAFGVHIDRLDLDINAAGLLTEIIDRLRNDLSKSF